MFKYLLTVIIFCFMVSTGYCALSSSEINILNLKEKNMYLLELKEKAIDIEVSNNELLEISPMTSINNNGKLLFINANKSGVCDVKIQTEKEDYKIRFISGSIFEDENKSLIKIDLPELPKTK